MASEVDIVNLAMVQLGQSRITTMLDTSKAAKSANAIFALERDRELRSHIWNFAVKRVQLAASTVRPAFGFQSQYPLPADYLRAIAVGCFAPGATLAVYRGGVDDVD